MTESDQEIISKIQNWIQKAVIGLNLCPFAQAVFSKDQIRYVVSSALAPEQLLSDLSFELKLLAATDRSKTDTTLLIHPKVLGDFLDYNDFLSVADGAVAKLGFEGVLQIASFHPQYLFEGSKPDDIENYSNRSPYPLLHILREESVANAIQTVGNSESIIEKNKQTLRRLGHKGWSKL